MLSLVLSAALAMMLVWQLDKPQQRRAMVNLDKWPGVSLRTNNGLKTGNCSLFLRVTYLKAAAMPISLAQQDILTCLLDKQPSSVGSGLPNSEIEGSRLNQAVTTTLKDRPTAS